MINVEPECSYDPETEVHSFNPMHGDEVIENLGEESTLIFQNINGITRIPIYDVEKTSNNIVQVISAETQTEIYEYHGLQLIDDEIIEEDMDPDLEEIVNDMMQESTTGSQQSRYPHWPGQEGECDCLGSADQLRYLYWSRQEGEGSCLYSTNCDICRGTGKDFVEDL